MEPKRAKKAAAPRRRSRKGASFDAFAKHVESARKPDGKT